MEEIKIGRERLKMLNKIIRHDLLNDFTVIRSAINIYRNSGDKSMIDEIQKRVEKSIKTIANYRKYESFIDANDDLEEIEVSEIVRLLPNEYPNLKFYIKGTCRAYANEVFSSVFTNIISNSVKHGNATQIDIIIYSEDDMCIIKIIDNGSGIPDEIKDKIFDEGFFYGKSGHTGIGLHIVKETIEHYGGSISVEDNYPHGAIFNIFFFGKLRIFKCRSSKTALL